MASTSQQIQTGESSSHHPSPISYRKQATLAVAIFALLALGAYLFVCNPLQMTSLSMKIGTTVAIVTGAGYIFGALYLFSIRPKKENPFKITDYEQIETYFTSVTPLEAQFDSITQAGENYKISELVKEFQSDSSWLDAMWKGLLQQQRFELSIVNLLATLSIKSDRNFSFDPVRDSLLTLVRKNPEKMMPILHTLITMYDLHLVSTSLSNEEKKELLLYLSTAKDLINENPQAIKAAIETILEVYFQDLNLMSKTRDSRHYIPSRKKIGKLQERLKVTLPTLSDLISNTSPDFKSFFILLLVERLETHLLPVYEYLSDKTDSRSEEIRTLFNETRAMILVFIDQQDQK